MIAGRYFNNFDLFQPPHRHTDPNDVLHDYNPSDQRICRRTGAALKNHFGTIRSGCSAIASAWKDSGKNDPDRFQGFCRLEVPLDRSAYYLW